MPNENNQNINFNLNPDNTPVLHVDSFLISHNEHTMIMNFAQALPDPKQQQIVSRVSLSRSQAREFLNTLTDHMKKFEV